MPRRDSFSSVWTDSSLTDTAISIRDEETLQYPVLEEEDDFTWVRYWPCEENYHILPQPLPYYPPLTQPNPLPESITKTIESLRTKIADVDAKKVAAEAAFEKATQAHKVAKEAMDKLRVWAITDIKRNELARLTREMSEEETKVDAIVKEYREVKNEFSPFEDILAKQAEITRIYEEARCVNAEANGDLMTNDMYDVLRTMRERLEKERLEEESTMYRIRLYPKKELVQTPEIVVKRTAPISWADAVQRSRS